MSTSFSTDIRLLTTTVLAIGAAMVAMPSRSLAFDSAMICAWQRTWHGQYPLATPLRPYFVPRLPGRCDREVVADACDYADGAPCGESAVRYNCPGPGPGWMYPPEAGIGFEPVQFQRLGQIPNDLGIGGATPLGAPPK